MKILHISDLHLDTPFTGIGQNVPELQKYLIKAPYSAFQKSVDIALQEKVDLFIISGDIYNSERQTINAQHFFSKQLERLTDGDIAVVLGHGNHDYLRQGKLTINYPENVKVFNNDEISYFDFELRHGRTVRVYGFSYTTQWIQSRKIEEYPINPFETDFTIGTLHASLETGDSKADNYAPFTVKELVDKKYDYWALGHIHKAQVLNESPLVQYPGNIQGRHRNETADKGCRIIELTKQQATSNQFYSLAPIIWQSISLDCENDWQANDLVDKIIDIKNNFLTEGKMKKQSYIIEFQLDNAQRLETELLEQIQAGELMDVIDNRIESEAFVYINRIKPSLNVKLEVFDYNPGLKESYHQVIESYEDGDRYSEVMSDLFNHTMVKQYFSLEEDLALQNRMIDSARKLIAQWVGLDSEVEDDLLED